MSRLMTARRARLSVPHSVSLLIVLLTALSLAACSGDRSGENGKAAPEGAVSETPAAEATGDAAADPAAEIKAEVPELDAFHEVIYPLWHQAWPERDLAMIKELLPEVQRHVAAVSAARLPGILRDKQGAWDEGLAALKGTLAEYESAVAAGDSTRMLAAVETIHGNYEGLVRTIRPVMRELDAYHVELYGVFHHALPNQDLDALRQGAAAMVARADALLAAPVPRRFEAQTEALKAGFATLKTLSEELVKTTETADWDAIKASVDAVHDQYVALEGMFDRPGH